MIPTNNALLTGEDPPPVLVDNPSGASPFLFLGDHAGNAVPAQLQMLGLDASELGRHIGWDIGVRSLGQMLAQSLDAVFVHQRFSRLVIDCNRTPDAADAIPETSDGSAVPGNRGLDGAARKARIAAIHAPYHAAIAAQIEERARRGQPTILVALHSFTPVMAGIARPWDAGILHDGGDTRFALALLAALRQHGDLHIGENEPYVMDGTDYTIPVHAYPRSLPYAEIEIRQDELGDAPGVKRWHRILGDTLTELSQLPQG